MRPPPNPARILLGVASGLVLLAVLRMDLPHASDGRFWSDAATYHAAAGSLAFDGDVAFDARDLERVRSRYPGGPQGVFLKRVADGGARRLVYAKPLLYPLVGAPFVRVFGVDRGLLLLNGLALVGALWAGFGLLRREVSPAKRDTAEDGSGWLAAVGALVILAAGVAPVYLFWQTPELFYLALVSVGLLLWRRQRPLLAALLLGCAIYGKPTNAALALPLLLAPLFGEVRAGGRWWSVWRPLLARAAVLALVVAAGFGLNRLATGEFNYQGGERKTFYDRYPGDPGVTFDAAGVWMTTDHVGPLVSGRDDALHTDRVAPPRTAEELGQAFRLNLLYFFVGRFGGLVPYYPGFVCGALLFLLVGPRDRAGWLAVVSFVVSWLGYIVLIPDNWYGGAGTLGNRYFLNVLALGFLLLPARRAGLAAVVALPLALSVLGNVFAMPVRHALAPGVHALAPVLRRLPLERTMTADLSVFTETWRRRRPFHLPGGDLARWRPGDPTPYYLWFPDDGTYGQEASFGEEGFWLRGGQKAEVLLQALSAPDRIRLVVTAGPAGDILTVRLAGERHRMVLPPLKSTTIVLSPRGAVGYYGSRIYRLRFDSRYGAPTDRDRRRLGSFVRVVLEP